MKIQSSLKKSTQIWNKIKNQFTVYAYSIDFEIRSSNKCDSLNINSLTLSGNDILYRRKKKNQDNSHELC